MREIMIPRVLCQPDFRFYKVRRNGKLPSEKRWNKDNCYSFNDPELINHDGNYGIVTGRGGLIVLDFDEREYYEKKKSLLKETFTVISATRRLPHVYYLLEGQMLPKYSVRDEYGKTLVDIQAHNVGIVGPNSKVSQRYYDVVNDTPIATITKEELVEIFNIVPKKKKPSETAGSLSRPEKYQKAVKIMKLLGIVLVKENGLYKCPFHEMAGKGNLSIMPDGGLYCFHEQKGWRDALRFGQELCQKTGNDPLFKELGIIRQYTDS